MIANKLLKAGDYAQAADTMANIVPSCPSYLAPEAELISNELGTCETNITASCQPPEVNQAQIDDCKPLVEGFIDKTKVCVESTGEDACSCWEKEISGLYESVLGCVIKPSENNVTERFKECKTAVGDCNKAQEKAFDVYVDCYSIKCPSVGLSCLNSDNSNVIGNGIITNSSMFNCSKNIFSRYEMEII